MTTFLTVNGVRHEIEAGPLDSLAHALRDELGLSGTKIGCYEGRCGACTVLLDGRPALACITPVAHAEAAEVTTVEGLGAGDRMTPLQTAMLDAGAVQCGMCTPGIVMLLSAFLETHPSPTDLEVRHALAGNLCRCTGYHAIVEAALSAAGSAR